MESTKSKEVEGIEVDAQYEKEFDEIIEKVAPKLDEMAARALKARAEGRTIPFPQ